MVVESEPELLADYECWTGEGPLYHPDEGVVYWLDIPPGELFRYDPETGDHEQCLDLDRPIGGFTIQDDGDLLLFLDEGTVRPWSSEDGWREPVVESIPGEEDARFNDVIAGPRGRVYCGTMPNDDPASGGGRLYRLDPDGSLTTILEDVAIPNGMGFTRDRRGFYFTETAAEAIYRFDYDQATGELSGRETFVDVSDEDSFPDGMTVDGEGYVWSARWNGGCLVRYAPDGSEDARVEFPAKKVSSVTFGGADYVDAFVTTALGPGEGEPGTKAEEGEGAGALFRFRPEAGGIPEFRSRIRG